MSKKGAPLWPKPHLELSEQEQRVRREWLLEYSDWGYVGALGWVQRQAHVELEKLSRRKGASAVTLEIGCGKGYHAQFCTGSAYVGLEHDREHLEVAASRYRHLGPVQGDAYHLPFRPATFDRVVSVYVFEHLHDLPASLAEVRRVLKPDGELLVGLPAEGGFAHEMGRRLTTRRRFEARYGGNYLRLARYEHPSTFSDVLEELRNRFTVQTVRYLPFRLPTVHVNAVVAMRCVSAVPDSQVSAK